MMFVDDNQSEKSVALNFTISQLIIINTFLCILLDVIT